MKTLILKTKALKAVDINSPEELQAVYSRISHYPEVSASFTKAMRNGKLDEFLCAHGLSDVAGELQKFKSHGIGKYMWLFSFLYQTRKKKNQELIPVGQYFPAMNELFALFKENNGQNANVLLYGPPGCGKTASARYFAGKHGLRFVNEKANYFESCHGPDSDYGASVFEKVREFDDCVLFLDEIDLIGSDRELMYERAATNTLLTELDGIKENNFLFVGATNAPWKLDHALLRSGRLDYCFYVPTPVFEERVTLLQMYSKGTPASADFSEIAGLTEFYSCADLKLLCRKAALNAALNKENEVETSDFAFVMRENPSTALNWFEDVSKMSFPHHYTQRFREWWEEVQAYKQQRSKMKFGEQTALAVT
ncbi:MAG: AAA family ATPase [Candidatus Micrarchaeota archaeon]